MSIRIKLATGHEARKRYKIRRDVGDFNKVELRGGARYCNGTNTVHRSQFMLNQVKLATGHEVRKRTKFIIIVIIIVVIHHQTK